MNCLASYYTALHHTVLLTWYWTLLTHPSREASILFSSDWLHELKGRCQQIELNEQKLMIVKIALKRINMICKE